MTKSKEKKDSVLDEPLLTNQVPREQWETFRFIKVIRAPSLVIAAMNERLAKIVSLELVEKPPKEVIPGADGRPHVLPDAISKITLGFKQK